MQKLSAIVSNLHVLPTMGSSMRSAKRPALVRPTSVEEYRVLKEWADNAPHTSARQATVAQISTHLLFLKATLPSAKVDDEVGQMRTSVYMATLQGYTDDALAYMSLKASQTLKWFPTPKECLYILSEYHAPLPDRDIALRLCHDFATSQFDRWLTNVGNGQPIGDVPDQWVRIAVEQGVLRRLADGSHVSRALYHGPARHIASVA